jgi:hypothetical protein
MPVFGSMRSRTIRSQAIVAMFIPMASPVRKRKRRKIDGAEDVRAGSRSA